MKKISPKVKRKPRARKKPKPKMKKLTIKTKREKYEGDQGYASFKLGSLSPRRLHGRSQSSEPKGQLQRSRHWNAKDPVKSLEYWEALK